MNNLAAQKILSLAVSEASLVADGYYTRPRTWGVYEINPLSGERATRRYRLGNHPVRQRELEAEFGSAKRLGLFTSRTLAEQLERLLNART